MKKLSFLDRYLTLWIFASMAGGVVLGNAFPAVPAWIQSSSTGTTNWPIAIGLIAMMLPPLAKVNYRLLPKVFANTRLLGVSLGLNWVVGPVLMYVLALIFLPDRPDLMTGVVLIGLARCIAMVLVWNDLADGSREYGAALVALNSLFQVFGYAFYAWLFLTQIPEWLGLYSVVIDLPLRTVAESVGLYLGVPFVLGWALRTAALTLRGADWFETRLVPVISPVTLVALLFTIVVMFSLKGEAVLAMPLDVLRVAVPLLIYFAAMFALGYFLSKRNGAPYDQRTAVAFTAAGNNFELAIAVAVGVFGIHSGEAFAGVIGPLVEVPALIALVGLAKYWQRRHG